MWFPGFLLFLWNRELSLRPYFVLNESEIAEEMKWRHKSWSSDNLTPINRPGPVDFLWPSVHRTPSAKILGGPRAWPSPSDTVGVHRYPMDNSFDHRTPSVKIFGGRVYVPVERTPSVSIRIRWTIHPMAVLTIGHRRTKFYVRRTKPKAVCTIGHRRTKVYVRRTKPMATQSSDTLGHCACPSDSYGLYWTCVRQFRISTE